MLLFNLRHLHLSNTLQPLRVVQLLWTTDTGTLIWNHFPCINAHLQQLYQDIRGHRLKLLTWLLDVPHKRLRGLFPPSCQAGEVEGRAERGKQICEAFQSYFCLPLSLVHDSQENSVTHGCPSQLCSDTQVGEQSKPRAEWRPRRMRKICLCENKITHWEERNHFYGRVRLCRNDAP